MAYIDLVDEACSFIVSKGYDAKVRRLDSMTGKEGIVVRRVPSTVVGEYRDRSKSVAYLWQVIIRRRSEKRALEEADALCKLLDENPIQSGNGSYQIVAQEVYTLPQELALEDSGFYAQEFRIRSYIEIERS